MSRKRSLPESSAPSVVTSGPLGPWRLSIAVAAAAVTTGVPLAEAAAAGEQIDLALGRSFVVAFFVWIVVGAINRILAQVEVDRALDARTSDDSTTEWSESDLPASPATGSVA